MKMSQRRNEERMKIYINRANRQSNSMRHMTKEDCKRQASGALQQKIWKPGELQPVRREQINHEANGKVQHKFLDPDILKMEGYDQEVIFLSFWGV